MRRILIIGADIGIGTTIATMARAMDQASLDYIVAVQMAAEQFQGIGNLQECVQEKVFELHRLIDDFDYSISTAPEPVHNFKVVQHIKPIKSKGGVSFKRGNKNFRR